MKTKSISRRDFIKRTATGTAVFALSPVNSLLANPAAAVWSKDAKKYTIYAIGHGHIDPVWLWPWTEGVAIVHSTFRSALDRMKETPDAVFTASSALFYQWIAENDPDMLVEIRQRVAEGRWNVVGGWWVEPDMNIPSGESMVRQGLYGQLTLQKLVGRRATVGFNPDSFGHVGTLPQIIHLQGMDNYVFMRPNGREKTLPANLFWWEGPDGTRVLTYRSPQGYSTGGDRDYIRRRLNEVTDYAKHHPVPVIMAFYGVGDHGGGPTKINIQAIREAQAEKGAPNIAFSGVDRYFDEVRAMPNLNLAVVKDDLQHHAVGCYTAECAIKKNNRLAEAALVTAEKITGVGSVIWKAAYPKELFSTAWQKVLFLQFHDSLAGSSLVSHSQDALEGYGYALSIAHEAATFAVQKLEWQVAAEDPDSRYILVFNPHAWEYKGIVAYDFDKPGEGETSLFTDAAGRSLPHQWVTGQAQTGGRRTALCRVTLPAMGYSQIRKKRSETPQVIEKPAQAEGNRLENEYYRITFAPNAVIGIFDKEAGKEVFAGGATGCRAVVIDDKSDTWSHDIKTFADEIGSFGNATVKVLEEGPLRATVRVISTYGKSTLTIDWSLIAGSRKIEANVTLDWHEQLKMLKFSFPIDITSPKATYEVPYGFIEREATGDEDPGQRWIDVTGQRGGSTCGLTVFNDAKYGYNVAGNDLRISVTRSAVFAHHDPKKLDPKEEYVWMDQGIQTLRLLLVPHRDSWKEINAPRIAEEFIAPPVVIYQGIHGGTMAKSGSYLSVDAPNVIVSSIKQSETGDDLIIRLVETLGKPASPTLSFPSANFAWKGTLKPCEIKTLRLNPDTGYIKEVNLLEE
ncbi:hypothetical protein AGMMS4957_11720 [Bacteroidia bacterium]|nr:hypothetical protein AGMMS4957_11720 [Bacteroidia bacterium]